MSLSVLNEFVRADSIVGIFNKTLLGSVLAADGLVNNSLTSLIPSMLISPLGSIIIRLATTKVNFNRYIGILIAVIIMSILCGYLYTKLFMLMFPDKKIPTKEMLARTEPNSLISNILIASVSTLSFNMATNQNDISTLIAIGIATSLLPPIVNIGSLYASNSIKIRDYIVTFSIFLINFCILYMGIRFFKGSPNNMNTIYLNITIFTILMLVFRFVYPKISYLVKRKNINNNS
jgi:hypothetical protein